jgi:hypothetical protein
VCLDGIINETDFSCTVNKTVVVTTSFPFEEFEEYYITECQGEITWENSSNSFDHMIRRSAVYFAVCGPLTMFYCVIAVLVYMLVTANERWEKALDFLVVTDIVFHVVWIFCWFIASVNWAVAFNRLENILDDLLDVFPEGDCDLSMYRVLDRDTDSAIYVQAQIAVVFGFLMQFLWAVNIWWLIIDTSWYINWRSRRAEYSALD